MTDPTTWVLADASSTCRVPSSRHSTEGQLVCARRHLLAAHRQRHRLTAHRHLRYARRHLLAAHPCPPSTVRASAGPSRAAGNHLTPYRISCPASHSLAGARHLRLPCHRRPSTWRRLQRAHHQLHHLRAGTDRAVG